MRTHIQKTKTKPMRKITREIIRAFEQGVPRKIDNSRTDGESLWLFDNKIAEWRGTELWICNGGWDSTTTKERLNGLSGVHIVQRGGKWFLNFRQWDGGWVNVDEWNEGSDSIPEEVVQEPEFDVTSEWMKQGYSRPVYSVYHTLVQGNLSKAEEILNEHGIKHRRMESDTEGMYRPNYFVIVHPSEHQNASWLVGFLHEELNEV